MSPEEQTELRRKIVAEAYSWLRTPYIHQGAIKGIGTDCAMILVEVYKACGMCPLDYDPRPYPPEWYLHQDETRYLNAIAVYAHRIEESESAIADIAVYNFGRHAAHGAIIVSDELMIHANRTNGNVELIERRAFASRLDSYWSVF